MAGRNLLDYCPGLCVSLLEWAKNELNEEKLPLVAVLAAGIFALQSFNLPVSMGTSGHLVGWSTRCDYPWFPVCRSVHPYAGADCSG